MPGLKETRGAAICQPSADVKRSPISCKPRRVRRPAGPWLLLLASLGTGAMAYAGDLTDALDTPGWTWTTRQPGGGGPWTVDTTTTHDGVDAARSGTPPVYAWAYLETSLTGPGTLLFWARRSEPAASYLQVGIEGSYCFYVWDTAWHAYAYEMPAGSNTFSFQFLNLDLAGDAAWVDQVSFADYSGQPPAIVEQPGNLTVGEGDSISARAVVTGDKPMVAAWFHNNVLAGLYITPLSELTTGFFPATTNDAGLWHLVVSNAFGFTNSAQFTLTVTSTPPHNLVLGDSYASGLNPLPLTPNAPVTLSVSGAGTPPLTYQWRHAGTNLPGANGTSLDLGSFNAAKAGEYECSVTNALGYAVAARTLELSVAPPVILTQPQPLALVSGGELDLWGEAAGPVPLAYQWFKDGFPLPGETAAAYYVWSVTTTDAGSYQLRVTNANGVAWSDRVTVAVDGTVPLGEALDEPGRPWTSSNGDPVTPGPGWLGETNLTHDGTDAAATVALPNNDRRAASLATQVNGPADIGFWWRLQGTSFDSLRFEWEDTNSNVTVITNVSGSFGWAPQTASLPPGQFTLRWVFESDPLSGGGAAGAAWLDQVNIRGTSLADALDTPNLVWTTGSSGSVAGDPAVGWFCQTNTTSDGSDAAESPPLLAWGSSFVETTVNGPTALSVKSFVAGDLDATLEFTIDSATQPFGAIPGASGPPTFYTNSYVVPPGSHTLRWNLDAGAQAGTNATAWLDAVTLWPGDVSLGVALDNTNLAWLGPGWTVGVWGGLFTGGSAAMSPPIPDSSSASLDTTIVGPAEIRFGWTIAAASGDFLRFYLDGQLHSQIEGELGFALPQVAAAVGAGVHNLRWSYEKDASGSAGVDAGWVDNVRVTPLEKPFILTQPADLTVGEGQAGSLSVTVLSPTPETYQWYRAGALPGETSNRLFFGSVQLGNAGSYSVVVANSFGSTTSRVATLTVNPIPPVFTNELRPLWVYPGEAVRLSVGATGPRPLTYLWQMSTNNFATTNLSGSELSPTYDIASVGYEHSGTWRVLAVDAVSGASATTSAKLVVGSRFYRMYPLTNGIPVGTDAWSHGLGGGTRDAEVVGRVDGGGYVRAYLFNRFGATPLDNLTNSGISIAHGMDDSSGPRVVGLANWAPHARGHPVRWDSILCLAPDPLPDPWEPSPCPKQPAVDLGFPPGFGDTEYEALAINSSGQIVVNANLQYVAAHYAFRWQADQWQRIHDWEWSGYSAWSHALDLSSLGYIAGYSDHIDYTFYEHAWVFDPHDEPSSPSAGLPARDLHLRYNFDHDAGYSRATGVNDWGHVVGWRKLSRYTGAAQAWLIARGAVTDFDLRCNNTLGKLKINNSGEIIADGFTRSFDVPTFPRPMLIRDDGINRCPPPQMCWQYGQPTYAYHRVFLLEDLVLGGIAPFTQLYEVSAINRSGAIAGTGRIEGTGTYLRARPFLLVPASAPNNHPPVAVNDTVTRFTDRVILSFTQLLLRNDSDPDPRDLLSLMTYDSQTTNGGTVFLQGDWLTYTPTNGFAGTDYFQYTITDHRGGLATATVTIRPENPRAIPPLGTFCTLYEPGTIMAVRFRGEAGATYRIEGSTTLAPGSWQTLAVKTAGPDGTVDTLDPSAILRQARFYRAVRQ
jgi:hypothetical protein